ncbi:M20 family metallopeptidase [Microbispora sp. GKU 823]|uniref:M20 metallopeptidase family protein n=1 Tax=Microbispora sp. GKU 823 TaxID=1652100 RepID=UPI001C4E0691|nr:M20 family metallopeptidase [Microbispora sp. GKU 823]
MVDDLVRLRRELHRQPEVGLDLPRTQEKVLAALAGLPLEITTGRRTTSVTAVLRGRAGRARQADKAGADKAGADGGVVLLRGDMDALPVHEATGLPYASTVDGAMHACGHDLHTAMLVGAARLLCAHRERVAGDVVFMFQPGEEGWEGARAMIDEGVLDAAGARADAAYALHVFPAFAPAGSFASRPGTMLAASASLLVTVRGEGGHGSTPHRAHDPVAAAAEMITALQTMVTRRFDVFDPVVLTVGVVQAGSRRNVIPETARFEATIRSFSADAAARARDLVPRLLTSIADAHGVGAEVEYIPERPPTVNDPVETGFARDVIAETFDGARHVAMEHPIAGSEDFSRVLAEVPGAFLALSALPPGADPETAPFNHSPRAVFDDAVVPDGAALLAELARHRLDRVPASSKDLP